MKKKYCPKPFVSVRLDTDQDGRPLYRPCCFYQGPAVADSLQDYFSSPHLIQLQQHMLTQSDFPKGCEACQLKESAGLQSLRQVSVAEHGDAVSQTHTLALEAFPGNACNLSCMMCTPKFSSSFAAEYKQLGWIDQASVTDFSQHTIDAIEQISDLKSVSFIGGEFFVTKNNLQILDVLIRRELQAKIVTNATVLTPAHMNKLRQIKQLDITVSVDGIGEVYELIRYPATWSVWENNVVSLKQALPHAKIHLLCVCQPLNLQVLPDLINWANINRVEIDFLHLQEPNWLNWTILTSSEKQQLAQVVMQKNFAMSTKQKQFLLNLLQMINSKNYNHNNRIEFNEKLSALIKHRNLDFNNTRMILGPLAPDL